MSETLRVLAIVAHPDDEAWCSGLLAAQVDAGLQVHLAVACNGNMGGMPDRTPSERAAIRAQETRSAAEIIGCALIPLGIGDDEMMERFTSDYTCLESRFRDLIRQVDPHLLLLHHPEDYHHHHRAVCEVALNASANAGNASIPGNFPASRGVPVTLFTQPIPPAPFVPHIYADITSTFERKIDALRAHESQHPFLMDHHATDFVALVSAAAMMHGAACGVRHAEAYALCHRFNRPACIQHLAQFFPRPMQGDDHP